jgi:endonuclease YncB( thermonuclease family)
MSKIEITFTGVILDQVIIELARHIEDGYHIGHMVANCSFGDNEKYNVELVKY